MTVKNEQIETLFVEALSTIDFSFLDAERGLLGESWFIDVELIGSLNDQGMIFDFSDVKKQIKHCVDDLVDHKLLVPARSSAFHHQIVADGQLEIEGFYNIDRYFYHKSPTQAVAFIDADIVSIETVSAYLQKKVLAILPDNVIDLVISLRNEPIEGAFFQYSHGLKKHLGNCQRIAHGHRSKLIIYIDGQRNQQLEQRWCDKWRGIYLVTREDICQQPKKAGRLYYRCAYQGKQGEFTLVIEQACCDVIEQEGTIECIAKIIAQRLSNCYPDKEITVKVYEGINKGAIARVG